MSEPNTELMSALLKNESLDEVFRSHLETAMNDLLKIELTEFLGYEKSSPLGYNTGNSRNGFYERDLDTAYGKLHIKVPRDRNGHFDQQLIPDYARKLMNHINSYPRKKWNGQAPLDVFIQIYGQETATLLDLEKNPSDSINLTPALLKK